MLEQGVGLVLATIDVLELPEAVPRALGASMVISRMRDSHENIASFNLPMIAQLLPVELLPHYLKSWLNTVTTALDPGKQAIGTSPSLAFSTESTGLTFT